MTDIEITIQEGIENIKNINAIDEITTSLAATLISVSFLQVGSIPIRSNNNQYNQLRKGNWSLDGYRSVLYVQSKEQKNNLFINKQRQTIGKERQEELLYQYKTSNSRLTYEEWCRNHNY